MKRIRLDLLLVARGLADAGRAGLRAGSWRSSQAKNSPYHWRELRGLRIQWFSSGYHSSRASTPRAFSVL